MQASRIPCVLLSLVFLAGCKPGGDSDPVPASGTPATPSAPPAPAEVVVSVNGASLTATMLAEEEQLRIKAMQQSVPPERLSTVTNRLRPDIIEEFITRALLLAEAERAGIRISDEELAKALNQFAARMAPGKTFEEIARSSPIGEKRMRQEIHTAMTISRLMSGRLASEASRHDADIDTLLAANSRERTEKRAQAEDIRAQLLAGGDFAALARQHSDCPSKEQGGDLGTFGRGQMVKPFEDAAFSQPVNAVGDIVETRFGYHIIQVLERSAAGDKSEGGQPVPENVHARHILVKAPEVTNREQAADAYVREHRKEIADAYIAELRSKATIAYGPAAR